MDVRSADTLVVREGRALDDEGARQRRVSGCGSKKWKERSESARLPSLDRAGRSGPSARRAERAPSQEQFKVCMRERRDVPHQQQLPGSSTAKHAGQHRQRRVSLSSGSGGVGGREPSTGARPRTWMIHDEIPAAEEGTCATTARGRANVTRREVKSIVDRRRKGKTGGEREERAGGDVVVVWCGARSRATGGVFYLRVSDSAHSGSTQRSIQGTGHVWGGLQT